jgi:alkanesulfonate monooxygenase SsuD/methylene tetrahydromethanopterin reductase-like flavin-dependent oxidoreductase (luciferase family)
MDFGLGVLCYHGCWDDAAFAEQHGFSTVGFVDSPLLGGETFACMALAAQATTRIRLGTFLAIPGGRSAPTTAQGIATINRLAPGRSFLGIGSGFTARRTFGLPPLPTAVVRAFVRECRGLLDGEEVVHRAGGRERPIRFRQRGRDSISLEPRVPIYVGADGPKALQVAGETADGWVTSLQHANAMANAAEVFSGSLAAVERAATEAGRSFGGAETIWSTAIGILEPGERPADPRILELVGAYAMMPFHSYADDPAIGEHLPPPIRQRLDVYRRGVLDSFRVAPDRRYQETHRGHLSYLLDGEAEVLTDEIVRMTTLTGTPEEIAERLRELEAAGLRNVSVWPPPHRTRDVVLAIEERVMPLLREARSR